MDALYLIALLAAILLLLSALYYISTYNRLQSLRNGAEATISQIRVAMKKRLDMVEELVDSVKSYARFESRTFEMIASLRTNLRSASPEDLREIDASSKGLLADIKAIAESYPQLRTSETVTITMNAIRDVEDEISRHRYTYNNIVQEFNTRLDTIPSSFIASSRGWRKLDYLNFEEDELRHRGYLTSEEELEPRRPDVKWG